LTDEQEIFMAEATSDFDIEGLHFAQGRPSRLLTRNEPDGFSCWWRIGDLRNANYKQVFSDRTDEEIDHFVKSLSVYSWSDPNKALGKGLRTRQRYTKPRVVAAFDENESLVGYAYGANNASSSRPGIVGAAERAAKLHVPHPRFESKRYFWLREIVPVDSERAGLVRILGGLLIQSCEPSQPVTCYPWAEETALQSTLSEWGMQWDGGEPETLYPFGENNEPTEQTRWVGSSAEEVLRNIVSRPGTAEAMLRARLLSTDQ
jgi:hypothetical protein